MTITPLTIYLIGSADNVCAFLVICCVLCCIAFGLSVFIIGILQDDMPRSESDPATWDYCERTAMTYVPAAKKTIKLSIPLFIVFLFLSVICPSTDTLTKMYILPPLVNSQIAQKLPAQLDQLIINSIQHSSTKGD